jgi:ribosomal-protein-alanine N-acetyltransferase
VLRAMRLRAEARVVGQIGFHSRPGAAYLDEVARGGIELGYTVFEPDRRRGYATEACRGLMDWAARTHGVTRFVVSIGPANVASLALAERLGFERVGSCVDVVDGPEDVFVRELAPVSAGRDS